MGNPFPRVKEAREALRAHALELLERHKALIEEAAAKGDLEAALKASQWLIEHMPAEDGERMIDHSASKPPEGSGAPQGPQIQIGIALGGMPKALPTTSKIEEIIDALPDDLPEHSKA